MLCSQALPQAEHLERAGGRPCPTSAQNSVHSPPTDLKPAGLRVQAGGLRSGEPELENPETARPGGREELVLAPPGEGSTSGGRAEPQAVTSIMRVQNQNGFVFLNIESGAFQNGDETAVVAGKKGGARSPPSLCTSPSQPCPRVLLPPLWPLQARLGAGSGPLGAWEVFAAYTLALG